MRKFNKILFAMSFFIGMSFANEGGYPDNVSGIMECFRALFSAPQVQTRVVPTDSGDVLLITARNPETVTANNPASTPDEIDQA